jgi:hypothetical protein
MAQRNPLKMPTFYIGRYWQKVGYLRDVGILRYGDGSTAITLTPSTSIRNAIVG